MRDEVAYSTESKDLYPRIFRSLLTYQRKNRYISSAWSLLSINEQQLIVELDRPGPVRVSDLAHRLCLQMANISSLLSQLLAKGLVHKLEGFRDKRESYYHLTAKGKEFAEEIDQLGNAIAHRYAATLSDQEQEQAHRFWSVLSDMLDAPPSHQRPGEHPLRREVRRLTRVWGVSSKSCGSTGLRGAELHIFLALESGAPLDLDDISTASGISKSSTNRVLEDYLKKGWVWAAGRKNSREKAVYSLTDKGRLYWKSTESQIIQPLIDRSSSKLERILWPGIFAHDKALRDCQCLLPEEIIPVLRPAERTDYFAKLIANNLFLSSLNDYGELPYVFEQHTESSTGQLRCWYYGFTMVAALELELHDERLRLYQAGVHKNWRNSEKLKEIILQSLSDQAPSQLSRTLLLRSSLGAFRELLRISPHTDVLRLNRTSGTNS